MHPLRRLLVDAAHGRFPAVDGDVEVHAPDRTGHLASVEFTGHSVVLADVGRNELVERGADGYGGASQPDLLRWLAGPDGEVGSHDAVLVTSGRGGGTLPERDDLDDHPRVIRSRRHRDDVRVFGDEHGLLTLGHGVVGRLELSVEVLATGSGAGTIGGAGGHGRRLIAEGLRLVVPDELVWAQVAPGNAASLRAFLACGFIPVGAETLILR